MGAESSLNFIVPLIFALVILAGIAIPAMRGPRPSRDRHDTLHATRHDETRVRVTDR